MHFWQHIIQCLSQHKKLVLLYVLDSQGSSPGRQGFRMVVAENGEMIGSIGGGIMEHKLVELAKSKLSNHDFSIILKHQIHSKTATENQSGMICSGEQYVTLIPILQKETKLIEQIITCIQKGENGKLNISPEGLSFQEGISNKPYSFKLINEHNWQYTEKIGFKKFAYIVGGGHVGKALTKVLVDLEYHCTVIDNREHLNTLENNHYAHQKQIIKYEKLGQHIREGKEVYLFIMTFGYRSDLMVLQQLINKQVAFIGMMGSQEKINQLMEEMKGLGYSIKQLAKVHSPIGLAINSRTPHEIAISIAAQLIQLTNTNSKGSIEH